MGSESGSVEVETTVQYVSADSTELPVRASLRYDPVDPYAVHVTFHNDEADVSWSFARELLAWGLPGRSGIGDVQIWPWATPRGDFIALALSSSDGNALFKVPRSVLVSFLHRTYEVVARGCETDHLDMDQAIKDLLSGRRHDT